MHPAPDRTTPAATTPAPGTPTAPTAPTTPAVGRVRPAPTSTTGPPRAVGRASAPPQPATTGPTITDTAAALLNTPALVVLTGGPGSGRSTTLHALATATPARPVLTGGGLAMLRTTPAFALARAVRARLPTHDPALLAEAVRSRVRTGLLLLDDLQWADPLTLAAIPLIATHCRVAVTLRTPHRLPEATTTALRAAAAGWLPLPALTPAAAADLAHRTAPGLSDTAAAAIWRRAGGLPLAVQTLARRAATHPASLTEPIDTTDGTDPLVYAIAQALADLTRPARTAMAALGLLGRPASTTALGPAAVAELTAADLVHADPDGLINPTSPYVAEIAAGLLDPTARQSLHQRLAELTPPAEAARHLAAAGQPTAAYTRALQAAATATGDAERADLLLLACQLPGAQPEPAIRRRAAHAALHTGRPAAAAAVLTPLTTGDTPTTTPEQPDHRWETAALHAEALLHLGRTRQAATIAATIADHAPPALLAARDRIRLLTSLPAPTAADLDEITTRHGTTPTHPGLRAALAAVATAHRTPGWEHALATAAASAGTAGDALTARWSAWLLVETLTEDGRLTEAARTAATAATACAVDLAYSWQTRFLAAELWCSALHGAAGRPDAPTALADDVLRRAADLTDRTLPAPARGYATAAASLVEADGGLLAPARARLADLPPATGQVAALLDWVNRETAWLDGQPARASAHPAPDTTHLAAGLTQITAWWAAHDATATGVTTPHPPTPPAPRAHTDTPAGTAVRETLTAWATDPTRFPAAAAAWQGLALREQVRCLLAHGLHDTDPQQAVPALLHAEQLAEAAGLIVLLGRVHRALRQHAVRRDRRGPRAGNALTSREQQVLRLVARGEPTRRIAGQLGISAETVESHIRAGMRKLGARTRTEAAALAMEVLR